MEVFVARQPIFNRSTQLDAYELLYRQDELHSQFDGSEAATATMQVIANTLLSFGLENILGGKKAFLNFDRTLLINAAQDILPPEIAVLEILETVEPDAEVITACARLRERGYTLALDDFVSHPKMEPLIPFAKIIKVDMRATERQEMERLFKLYGGRGIAMLAEKVETHEEFEWAHGIGYDLFQGYFFARPSLVRCQQIPSDQITCLRLLSQLQQAELDPAKVQILVSQDASLCYKLLRYANSGLFGFRVEIRSIEHALAIIGQQGIRHWIGLAAVPALAKEKPKELVTHTLVRARFCERLAELSGRQESGRAFLMGILSLIDVLTGVPLDEALDHLAVDSQIRASLLGTAPEQDVLGVIYALACKYEEGAWHSVDALHPRLQIKPSSISAAYAESMLWARQVLHSTNRRADTRRYIRFVTDRVTFVRWEDAEGRERVSSAKLLNVSTHGIQLQLNEKIPYRSYVSCSDAKLHIAGTGLVRYCNFNKGKFLIGLEFPSGTGWRPLPDSDGPAGASTNW